MNTDDITGDLIYDKIFKDDREKIKERWPKVEFEETHDAIHEYRTIVHLKATRKEWFEFLIHNEMHELSFVFQLDTMQNSDFILEILKELKNNE